MKKKTINARVEALCQRVDALEKELKEFKWPKTALGGRISMGRIRITDIGVLGEEDSEPKASSDGGS